jgi:hypothetical protein
MIVAIVALASALLQGQAIGGPTLPAAVSSADSVAIAGPVLTSTFARPDTVPVRRRQKAIEVSDAYATRLRIHHLASYPVIPLFLLQSVAGNQLYVADQNGSPRPGWAKNLHSAGAAGLGALFTINTVTGLWNLYDSRNQEEGRGRRVLHSVLMLASDVGFTYTGIKLADDAKGSSSARTQHRNLGYISMGTALAGYGIMLFGNH